MHPNTYLQTFWRMEMRPEVFVAMSFADVYAERYANVIRPAIERLVIDGTSLTARRVDASKSGDSILTEIMDGVAHSRLVLADVSSIGNDSRSGRAYRNGNVMYEVGLALACRQPTDVLLVRDDNDQFLFDVSTIPHMQLDFTADDACDRLHGELAARLREQDLLSDARVQIAATRLTDYERQALQMIAQQANVGTPFGIPEDTGPMFKLGAWHRLVDKQVIRATALADDQRVAYVLTPLGQAVLRYVQQRLPLVSWERP